MKEEQETEKEVKEEAGGELQGCDDGEEEEGSR